MRTGIKHLLGMSATLLLLLTVILWVDSHYNFSRAEFDPGRWTLIGTSQRGTVSCVIRYNSRRQIGGLAYSGFDWMRVRHEEWSVPTKFVGFHWIWKHFVGYLGVEGTYGVSAPHWVGVLIFGIPTVLYLRFLYRHRLSKPEPTPEESAI